MTLLGLLIAILIACVVLWAARALLSAFGLGEPLYTVVVVVVLLLLVLWLASQFGYGPGLRLR
jgi:hypothetical protein